MQPNERQQDIAYEHGLWGPKPERQYSGLTESLRNLADSWKHRQKHWGEAASRIPSDLKEAKGLALARVETYGLCATALTDLLNDFYQHEIISARQHTPAEKIEAILDEENKKHHKDDIPRTGFWTCCRKCQRVMLATEGRYNEAWEVLCVPCDKEVKGELA